jgi:hypothetical protein
MRLTPDERDMLSGHHGEAVRRAIEYQIRVGEFFQAEDLVPVRSVHIMAEMECMHDAGLAFVEETAALGGQFVVPTTTNPRSVDFAMAELLGQDRAHVEQEHRLVEVLRHLGAVICDTCINYETVYQPRFGEHVAWGDTGTVIYANSVMGARSNFEGGPAALAAGLTGRVPRYGYHLDSQRRGTILVDVRASLRDQSDWGALGCLIGRRAPGYWEVPVIRAPHLQPRGPDLKHLGAALASFGSHAMFHFAGVTPEARTADEAFQGASPPPAFSVTDDDIRAVYASFHSDQDHADLVVFGTPQLSLLELRDLAERLRGRRVHPQTRLLLTTNFQVKALADQLGYSAVVRDAGGMLLAGVCFYLMTARELAARFGFRTIVTNSAKLANIIAGYGYAPVFRDTATCVEILTAGRIGARP